MPKQFALEAYWFRVGMDGSRCPIVDIWRQTGTGGQISPLSGDTPLVPGSCTLPLPGMAAIVDEAGQDLPAGKRRALDLKRRVIDPRCCAPSGTLLSAIRRATSRTESAASCTFPAMARCATPRRDTSRLWPHRRRAQRVLPLTRHDGDLVGADCAFVVAAAMMGRPDDACAERRAGGDDRR